MKCVICRFGDVAPGLATVTLQRGDCTVVFKDVPAEICDSCGEYYLTPEVAEATRLAAEEVFNRGTAYEVVRYAA
jgi:YgiT-type zinc finger domain-containing protein